MAKTFAVLDLSWEMHKFAEALSMLSVTLGGKQVPTGHVHGTLMDIAAMSSSYDKVILAVDSFSNYRKEALPEYKTGRSQGQPERYNIYNDLYNILALATSLPNVYYIKVKQAEADDIIASMIHYLGNKDSVVLSCFFNDKDILQTQGTYLWYTAVTGRLAKSRYDYIKKTFGYEKEYLPVWHKVLEGDTSDKIPNLVPRLPKDKLREIVEGAVAQGFDSCEDFISYLQSPPVYSSLSATWKSKLYSEPNVLRDDLSSRIQVNYTVVKPRILPVSDLQCTKVPMAEDSVQKLIQRYSVYQFSQYRNSR